MINNTTWTAATLKTRLTNHFGTSEISDENIRLALNFFYAVLGKARRQSRRSDNRKTTSAISITSSGYDLTNITDIDGVDEGFEVFRNQIKKSSQIFERNKEDSGIGYYIEDTTLYLLGETSGTIIIKYQKRSPRIADGDALSSHTLEINQDLEQAVFRFAIENFLDGKFRYEQATQNEDKYFQQIVSFFDRGTKTKHINPNRF